MHDLSDLIHGRIQRLLTERIRPAVHPDRHPLEVAIRVLDGEPVPPAEGMAGAFEPAEIGQAWGAPWSTTWLKLTGSVPAEWAGRQVEGHLDLGFSGGPGFQAEGLVFDAEGKLLRAVEPDNALLPWLDSAKGGEVAELYVEAAANPDVFAGAYRPTPLGDPRTAPADPLYRLVALELVTVDPEVRALAYDTEILLGLAESLPKAARRQRIFAALDRMADVWDAGGPAAAAQARAALQPELTLPASAGAHRVSAVGHAHIDSAWLWPLRETIRKCARSFSNVVALAERHPELRFACSQAQQYAWMQQHYPDLFERIRKAVADGTFVPIGGMWVEPDSTMPGGEAMARQLVAGQRFFAEEFGVTCTELWLPDSFGYSPVLPQLAALAGMHHFVTQKLSWNETNRFPHSTFAWEGLDGTRMLTHFPPVDTYNSVMSPAELSRAASNHRDAVGSDRSLVPFGHGDGGGGPTEAMLERAARQVDLDGSPRVRIETAAEFFAAVEAEYEHPPVWVGELYLETHRGTFTSQQLMKRGNRRSEHLLREVELWAATAALRDPSYAYPYDELERLWRSVLLLQFHDILPGSSIAWVHEQAADTYVEIERDLVALRDDAVRALVGDGDRELAFNATPHTWLDVPAGAAAEAAHDAGRVGYEQVDGGVRLDNGVLRVVVDADGLLAEVHDLVADRPVLAPGTRGNLLQLHPDHPTTFDAWNVDYSYRHSVVDLTDAEAVDVVAAPEDSAVTVTVRRSFGSSTATQTLTLRAGSRELEFGLDVDWHEQETFLKVAFGIDVHTDHATSEVQFGHLRRPTHENTSWDAARFETVAHRYVHVGDAAYGAALVNDSVYGHDISRHARDGGGTYSLARLSLLRGARFPDPEADQGPHAFAYGLVCGADIGAAVRYGYRQNLPLRTVRGAHDVAPLVTVDDGGSGQVVVESVKLAEDRSGDLVVRLYEAHGALGTASVELPAGAVTEVDLMERPRGDRTFGSGDPVRLRLRPFEIVTLRVACGTPA